MMMGWRSAAIGSDTTSLGLSGEGQSNGCPNFLEAQPFTDRRHLTSIGLLVVASTPSHVGQDRRRPAGVIRIHVRARRVDLVNAVEHVTGQFDFGRAELG